MSEQIRDVTTITFSGPRFDDAGLDLDVLPELLAYRKLLLETAKQLWRARKPGRRRLPKGFGEAIRLKLYTVENESVTVRLKRVVQADEVPLFASLDQPDEIDDAAQLIDETIEAFSRDEALPKRMPKAVLSLLADFGAALRPDETVKTQSIRSLHNVEFSPDVRRRVSRLMEAVHEDRIDSIGEVRSADVDHRNLASRNVTRRRIPAKSRREYETRSVDVLHDAVHSLQPWLGGNFEMFDSSARPIWETLAELGESVPAEVWDRVPEDLSKNLDRYLYDKPKDTQ